MGIHDQKLTELLRGTRETMPDEVRNRIDDTLSGLPERKKNWRKPSMIASAAVVSLFVLGSAFTNPTMADMLQQIPLIDSVFKLSGDQTLETTVENGLAEKVDHHTTNNGITIAASEAIYDGTRLSIGYVIKSDTAPVDKGNSLFHYLVDGKELENDGILENLVRYDDHTFLGVMHIDTASPLPSEFELQVHFKKLLGQEGNWNMAFPVTENTAENKVILPMEKKASGDITVILEKVTIAPTATEVIYKLSQPADREMELNFELFGQNGEKVDTLSLFKEGDTYKVSYEPFDTLPETFKFRPKSRSDQEIDKILEKLEMDISIIEYRSK